VKAHIRHIAHKRKGIVTESEKTLAKQSIEIGRATDQDIFLSDTGVSYHHARINLLPDGTVSVSSVSRLGFYIEGKLVQNCLIQRNGEILIGVFNIKIEIHAKQELVEITIEKIAEDIVEVAKERMLPTSLEQTWLSKRSTSWLGFILMLVVFLGFPLAEFYDSNAKQAIAEFNLPGDDLWLSGEISSPHRHFGNDCNKCHQQPFIKVRDSACLDCHKKITAHADPDLYDVAALQETRCATCHKEHNGTAHLIQTAQKLCSDCHGALVTDADSELNRITDFGIDHTEFKVSLITRSGLSRNDPQAWQRISLDDPAIRHETGLVFPHDVHLAAKGVDGPLGNQVLVCNDCHRTDASGNYMIPIAMEPHCQSCHRLEFDPDDLDRELPHSDLLNMRKMLNEYYSLKALRGGITDPDAPDLVTERRRPGKSLTRKEQEVALKWALQKAELVAEEVVEFRSCNLCHKVERDPSITVGWKIPEVNTAQSRWLPKGDFDHKSHRNSTCESCHDARSSTRSEDVLLPKIAVCRECHGGQNSNKLLQSTCIECHDFHQEKQVLMEVSHMGSQ
jgi:predicted CXXCH cytochrome family protein